MGNSPIAPSQAAAPPSFVELDRMLCDPVNEGQKPRGPMPSGL